MSIERHPLLAGLSPADRDHLATRLAPRTYRRGQVVFRERDPGDCLHLVATGRFAVHVATPTGLEMIVRVVHPDEFFGELALVRSDTRRNGTVVALEPGRTAVLHRRDFVELRESRPALDRLLVTALAERVARMTEEAVEATLPPVHRVWRRLAVLADAYGDEPVRVSQDDVARMTGTVRQTVNRALALAAAAGAIERGRGEVRVRDRDWLAQPPVSG